MHDGSVVVTVLAELRRLYLIRFCNRKPNSVSNEEGQGSFVKRKKCARLYLSTFHDSGFIVVVEFLGVVFFFFGGGGGRIFCCWWCGFCFCLVTYLLISIKTEILDSPPRGGVIKNGHTCNLLAL